MFPSSALLGYQPARAKSRRTRYYSSHLYSAAAVTERRRRGLVEIISFDGRGVEISRLNGIFMHIADRTVGEKSTGKRETPAFGNDVEDI